MESPAFKYLHEATMEELGESTPFSMCGSLPLVGDMKEAGFDVQVRDLPISRRLSAIYLKHNSLKRFSHHVCAGACRQPEQ